jgi:hypothetical protein
LSRRTLHHADLAVFLATRVAADIAHLLLGEGAAIGTGQICVVESPADIYAIEQTGQYSGRYFVLMGHLSPLDSWLSPRPQRSGWWQGSPR